uniref:Uncharacterized protein n=1 Tax=Panagrolaimus sp. ES5 TaxID=591445 RepID=A0AC34FIJ5_9BILA
QPNGGLELCTGPGSGCSQPAYTCQLSTVLSQWVCCGASTTTPICADGRETYTQQFGSTYSCNPLAFPSNCPPGYDCASSTQLGTNVCCRGSLATPPPFSTSTFRPPIDVLDCPSGWTGYSDATGAHRFCEGATDMSCPQGFSCTQSSVQGIFLCCRIAANLQCATAQNQPSTFICCRSTDAPRVCPNNQNALLQPNGGLELCTGPGSGCSQPAYTCQLSTVLSQWVCCGASTTTPICADGRETYTQQFGSTYSCNPLAFPSNCPPGYDCASSTQLGTNVCCRGSLATPPPFSTSTFRPPIDVLDCPSGWTGYSDATGAHRFCEGATDMSCPQGFINICCASNTDPNSLMCADGQTPAYIGTNVRYCQRLGLADVCPPSYVCARSNRQGLNVCCHYSRQKTFSSMLREESAVCGDTAIAYFSENNPGKALECTGNPSSFVNQQPDAIGIRQVARCLGRSTLLLSGNPVSCSSDSGCQDGYECSSHTTQGEAICCGKPALELRHCPDNRNPLRDPTTDSPISCDSKTCPTKSVCKKSPSNGQSFCCSLIAFCPANMQPQLDSQTRHAKRCFGFGCPAGFSCIESTVSGIHICCRQSLNDDTVITPPPNGDYHLPSDDEDDETNDNNNNNQKWVVLDG